MGKLKLMIIILTALTLSIPFAHGYYGSTYGQSLTLPFNVRSAGMGGSSVSLDGGSDAIFVNDASLNNIYRMDIYSSILILYAGMRSGSFSAAVRLGEAGIVGAGLSVLDYGNIPRTGDDGSSIEGAGTIFGASEMVIKLSYANTLFGRIKAGGGLKVLSSKIDSDTALSFLAEAGVLVDNAEKNTSLGFTVNNFELPLTKRSSEDTAPLLVTTGISRKVKLLSHNSIRFSLDVPVSVKEDVRVLTGIEYCLYDTFFLRAGYRFYSYEQKYSVGAGIRYTTSLLKLRLDFAYTPLEGLGSQGKADTIKAGLGCEF